MIKIEGKPGEHISDTAARAIARAKPGDPVELEFNEITITVWHTLTASDVCAEYDRIGAARHAVYIASPEYKERQRLAEVRDNERAAGLAAALAKAPAMMTLKDADGWAKACAANTDGYGACCMRYAETWARIMEGLMTNGATVEGCAKEASHLADTEGITGFMHGAAVGTLAAVWVHGEALRR